MLRECRRTGGTATAKTSTPEDRYREIVSNIWTRILTSGKA